ncbi:MAG TPA: hypothetical protein VGL83_14985 [Stellaceae bacterium]|jgi:hypothetical protein
MNALIWPATLAVAALACATFAKAEPPPNADPALAPWYQSLRQPDTGVSCCSIADCRATDYRTNGDHYEVLIDDKWTVVPKDKVLQRVDNPVGRAVVCWTPALGVMCFVRATET